MGEVRPVRIGSGFLYVEVEDADVPLPTPAKDGKAGKKSYEDTPDDAQLVGFREDLEEAVGSLRGTINDLAAEIAEALERAGPAEWTVEFNIGFKGKAHPIPVLLGGEANGALKVTATWHKS